MCVINSILQVGTLLLFLSLTKFCWLLSSVKSAVILPQKTIFVRWQNTNMKRRCSVSCVIDILWLANSLSILCGHVYQNENLIQTRFVVVLGREQINFIGLFAFGPIAVILNVNISGQQFSSICHIWLYEASFCDLLSYTQNGTLWQHLQQRGVSQKCQSRLPWQDNLTLMHFVNVPQPQIFQNDSKICGGVKVIPLGKRNL